jgi:NADH dehydrogenase FAD-containing subunit
MAKLEPNRVKTDDSEPEEIAKNDQSRLTMVANGIRLFRMTLGLFLPHSMRLLRLWIATIHNSLSYKPVDSPQNIVVVGGSFAGVQVAKWLANTVPTGYRVVLVEKNSHFNFLFAFPRYSVVSGYEQGAFIPFDDILRGAIRKGSLWHIQAEASGATANQVLLANGQAIDYAYLVVATGSWQKPPAKMSSTEHEDACGELRDVQCGIAEATRIAVVGSGAVGVEIAADIKSYFPDKDVTLFSSRNVVMPTFGPKLQTHVTNILNTLGVVVRYNARPNVLPDGKTIQFSDGTTEDFDLVVCLRPSPSFPFLNLQG